MPGYLGMNFLFYLGMTEQITFMTDGRKQLTRILIELEAELEVAKSLVLQILRLFFH